MYYRLLIHNRLLIIVIGFCYFLTLVLFFISEKMDKPHNMAANKPLPCLTIKVERVDHETKQPEDTLISSIKVEDDLEIADVSF